MIARSLRDVIVVLIPYKIQPVKFQIARDRSIPNILIKKDERRRNRILIFWFRNNHPFTGHFKL